MDNDILEATLVESDDEPESDEISPQKKHEGDEEESLPDPDNEIEKGEEEMVIAGRSRRREETRASRRTEDRKSFGEDEEKPDSSKSGSEVKKAMLIDEPPERKPSSVQPVSPTNQLTLAVIALVAIIILAAAYYLIIDGEESKDIVVNVPDLQEGDEGRYTVSGSIDIRDAENDPIAGEIISGKIDLKGSYMVVKAEGVQTVTDGYFREYSALKTYTLSTWKVNGYLDTESYDIVDIDGSITINSDAYRNGDTILLTDMEADTNIEARSRGIGIYARDIDSEDHLRTYSSDASDIQTSLDEVIHRKDLKKGMSGEFSDDDVRYEWKVTGNAEVYKTDCVVVKFTVLKPLPEDLEYQSIKLYLSNKHPIPVKTELELVIVSQGRVTVRYTMTMNHYNPGSGLIVIPNDDIIKSSPYLEQRFMDVYPPLGTTANTSISYDIKDAHEKALDKSGLQGYLDSHTDAYLVQGIYNETDGPVWNLTYSHPDAETGYVVLVTESKVDDIGEMKLGDAGSALAVNAEAPEIVLSWAGAEQILKHDDEVKDTCFTGEKINLHSCNFGVRTRLYQPSVDLVSMFASAPRVDYGYTITKGDEFAAGLDADTGQILFVATHDGPELF